MKEVSDIKDVEYEIKKALLILRQMPRIGPSNVKSCWPQYLNESTNLKQTAQAYTYPLPEEIDDMDEVLEDWLKQIDFDNRNLVIMRNNGYGWKSISAKLNLSRSRLYDKYTKSLKIILKYVLEKQKKNSHRRLHDFS